MMPHDLPPPGRWSLNKPSAQSPLIASRPWWTICTCSYAKCKDANDNPRQPFSIAGRCNRPQKVEPARRKGSKVHAAVDTASQSAGVAGDPCQ
jgi:hypothetical protein